MTKAEHAQNIRRTLRAVERATAAHHEALAAAVREYGDELGLGGDIVAAAAPKNPPTNED